MNVRLAKALCLAAALLSSVARADMSTGLIAYWRLDDGSGTSAADASGNGRTGTLTGGASFTAGQLVGGVGLDGNDGRIVVAHHSSLSPTAITVAAWVYPDTWSGTLTTIVSKQANQTGFPAFDFRRTPSAATLQAALCVGTTNYTATTPADITAGSWQHVAFTYDGETIIVYLNTSAGTHNTTPSGSLAGTTVDLWIGGNPSFSSGRYFDGKVDEVRIYNRALSGDDIIELYNYRRPEPLTSTIPGTAAVDPLGSFIPGGP